MENAELDEQSSESEAAVSMISYKRKFSYERCDMEDSDQPDPKNSELELLLPGGYTYKILNFEKQRSDVICTFRIKELRSNENALEWLKVFESKTLVQWRKSRTFKSAGVQRIFRGDYRCQHKTDSRFRKKEKRSKNTDCPARLKIIIQRYFEVDRYKKPDTLTVEYPCVCDLHWCHNHSLTSDSILKFRKISDATKEKLKYLFMLGHTVPSARNVLETELRMNNEGDYKQLAADRSLVPSVSVIRHLYIKYAKMYEETGKIELEPTVLTTSLKQPEIGLNSMEDSNDIDCGEVLDESNGETCDENNLRNEFKTWSDSFWKRVDSGLKNNSSLFEPAVKQFLSNAAKFSESETDLLSSLHSFNKPATSNRLPLSQHKRKFAAIPNVPNYQEQSFPHKRKCLVKVHEKETHISTNVNRYQSKNTIIYLSNERKACPV